MAVMTWEEIRNKKKNAPVKNNSQSNDVWDKIRAARGIQTPKPTQTPQSVQPTPTTPTPEAPKQKRYGLFGENSLFNDIKTGVKKLQAKGEQRTRETYGPKTPELQLSKALREEKSAETTAKIFTAPVRFTAGSLATLATSYALEKANSNKKYTPKTDAEKLIIGKTDIQRITQQEDLYGIVARSTSIPVALTLAAIIENPFIKGTGAGTFIKTSLESAINKKVISTVGTKELIKLADEAIEAEVKIGKITPDEALKALFDINNFRVKEIVPSKKLLPSKKVGENAGELSGELLKRGQFDSKGSLVKNTHNDSLVKEIEGRLNLKSNLIQEARKYKSAEEFVKANRTNQITGAFKADPEYTKLYNEMREKYGVNVLNEMTPEENIKLLNLSKKNIPADNSIRKQPTIPTNDNGTLGDITTGTEYFHATTPDRLDSIIKNGLSIKEKARGVNGGGQVFVADTPEHAFGFMNDLKIEGAIPENTKPVLLRVRDLPHEGLTQDIIGRNNSLSSGTAWSYDSSIPAKFLEVKKGDKWYPLQTKSQLTDIYNQATKAEIKPITPEVVPPRDTFTPKVSQRISDQAIAEGLVKDAEEFGELPVQQVQHLKDQSLILGKVIDEDPELLKEIAKGKASYPGLNPSHAFITVKNQALKNNDLELLRELATSPSAVPQQATEAGRLIQALDESSDDAFKNIKKVVDSRKDAVKDKISKEVSNIKKKDIIKKSSPKKDEWLSFLDEIKCPK